MRSGEQSDYANISHVENTETDKRKCITCGFAAKRARIPIWPQANPSWFELPLEERQEGKILVLSTGGGNSAADIYDIACFRGKKDLVFLVRESMAEADLLGGTPTHIRESTRGLASKQVLEKTGCDSWFQYEAGRTPQEHLSDLRWEQLEKQRQEFEIRLFEAEQRAQENTRLILADSRQYAKDSKEIVEQMKRIVVQIKESAEGSDGFIRTVNKWLIFLTVLILILTAVQVSLAIWAKPSQPIIIQQVPADQPSEPKSDSPQ